MGRSPRSAQSQSADSFFSKLSVLPAAGADDSKKARWTVDTFMPEAFAPARFTLQKLPMDSMARTASSGWGIIPFLFKARAGCGFVRYHVAAAELALVQEFYVIADFHFRAQFI